MVTITELVELIQVARLDLSDEKQAQQDLEDMLIAAEIPYAREVRLSKTDIVDFLIDGIAVELKLQSSTKKAIYNQLVRYSRHDRVEKILLASNRSMGLPEEINGKDTYFVKLSEAWL